MFNTKKSIMAALLAGALALGARTAQADTITVTTYTPGTNASAGIFAYDVNFSATAVVETGDGFFIADFGTVMGSPSFSTLDGTPPTSADFAFSQPDGANTGSLGLNGETGSTATTDIFTNSSSIATSVTDSPTVADAVFIYSGPTFDASAGSDLIVTLHSAETGSGGTATSLGVDNSGVGGNTISLGESTVLVPSVAATPLPASLLGSGFMVALLAGYRARKAWLMA